MAVAFGAMGTITHADTTSINVAYPSGITAGQKLVLSVYTRRSGGVTVSTPSGWASSPTSPAPIQQENQIYVFTRIATGSESGSVAVSATTNDAISGVICRYTTSLGTFDDDAGGGGLDEVTGWDMTTTQTIQRVPGDLLIAFANGTGSSARTWSNNEIDGQAAINRTSGLGSGIKNPNDNVQVYIADAYSSITSTSVVNHSADLNSNMAGPGFILRLHDYTAGGGHTDKRIWGSIPIKADS